MKTGHKPAPVSSPLGRIQVKEMDVEEVKRDGWNNHRILVVRADDDRIGWIEKQVIEQIGNRLFGGRR